MTADDARSVLSLGRRAVLFELRLYRSLFRWVTRRPAIPGGDVQPFGYTKAVTPVMWLWIFASAAEMVVVHLLVPWPAVRIILLIVSAWGLIWMIGFLASLKVHPHLLGDATLRVRHGASVDITIPWDAIASVVGQRRDLPSSMRTVQLRETDTGTDLQVGVSGEVNVRVKLKHPLTVPTPKGAERITELSFLTDDPSALVTQARQHLTSASARQDRRPG
jgi:hypothetical protein